MSAANPPAPASRVLVSRDGRIAWHGAGRFQGQQDPPLVAAGRSEAVLAARAGVLCASAAGSRPPRSSPERSRRWPTCLRPAADRVAGGEPAPPRADDVAAAG